MLHRYETTKEKDGSYIIHDVPIFAEISRDVELGESVQTINYDENWINTAVAEAKRREMQQHHKPALYVEHNRDGKPIREIAGFILNQRAHTINYDGKPTRTVYADLVITLPEIFEEIRKGQFPGISVEIKDSQENNPQTFTAAALLNSEPPALKFDPLLVKEPKNATERPKSFMEARKTGATYEVICFSEFPKVVKKFAGLPDLDYLYEQASDSREIINDYLKTLHSGNFSVMYKLSDAIEEYINLFEKLAIHQKQKDLPSASNVIKNFEKYLKAYKAIREPDIKTAIKNINEGLLLLDTYKHDKTERKVFNKIRNLLESSFDPIDSYRFHIADNNIRESITLLSNMKTLRDTNNNYVYPRVVDYPLWIAKEKLSELSDLGSDFAVATAHLPTIFSEEEKVLDSEIGMKREDMPQIKGKNLDGFLDFLSERGIQAGAGLISPTLLKPTQEDLDLEKVDGLVKSGLPKGKPVLVSSDMFILDGHHRWKAGCEIPVNTLEIQLIELPIDELLSMANEFEGTATDEFAEEKKDSPKNSILKSLDNLVKNIKVSTGTIFKDLNKSEESEEILDDVSDAMYLIDNIKYNINRGIGTGDDVNNFYSFIRKMPNIVFDYIPIEKFIELQHEIKNYVNSPQEYLHSKGEFELLQDQLDKLEKEAFNALDNNDDEETFYAKLKEANDLLKEAGYGQIESNGDEEKFQPWREYAFSEYSSVLKEADELLTFGEGHQDNLKHAEQSRDTIREMIEQYNSGDQNVVYRLADEIKVYEGLREDVYQEIAKSETAEEDLSVLNKELDLPEISEDLKSIVNQASTVFEAQDEANKTIDYAIRELEDGEVYGVAEDTLAQTEIIYTKHTLDDNKNNDFLFSPLFVSNKLIDDIKNKYKDIVSHFDEYGFSDKDIPAVDALERIYTIGIPPMGEDPFTVTSGEKYVKRVLPQLVSDYPNILPQSLIDFYKNNYEWESIYSKENLINSTKKRLQTHENEKEKLISSLREIQSSINENEFKKALDAVKNISNSANYIPLLDTNQKPIVSSQLTHPIGISLGKIVFGNRSVPNKINFSETPSKCNTFAEKHKEIAEDDIEQQIAELDAKAENTTDKKEMNRLYAKSVALDNQLRQLKRDKSKSFAEYEELMVDIDSLLSEDELKMMDETLKEELATEELIDIDSIPNEKKPEGSQMQEYAEYDYHLPEFGTYKDFITSVKAKDFDEVKAFLKSINVPLSGASKWVTWYNRDVNRTKSGLNEKDWAWLDSLKGDSFGEKLPLQKTSLIEDLTQQLLNKRNVQKLVEKVNPYENKFLSRIVNKLNDWSQDGTISGEYLASWLNAIPVDKLMEIGRILGFSEFSEAKEGDALQDYLDEENKRVLRLERKAPFKRDIASVKEEIDHLQDKLRNATSTEEQTIILDKIEELKEELNFTPKTAFDFGFKARMDGLPLKSYSTEFANWVRDYLDKQFPMSTVSHQSDYTPKRVTEKDFKREHAIRHSTNQYLLFSYQEGWNEANKQSASFGEVEPTLLVNEYIAFNVSVLKNAIRNGKESEAVEALADLLHKIPESLVYRLTPKYIHKEIKSLLPKAKEHKFDYYDKFEFAEQQDFAESDKPKPRRMLQTIVVSKTIAKDEEEASNIAGRHGKTDDLIETKSSWRFRQRNADEFDPDSFKTSKDEGIALVYADLLSGEEFDEKGDQDLLEALKKTDKIKEADYGFKTETPEESFERELKSSPSYKKKQDENLRLKEQLKGKPKGESKDIPLSYNHESKEFEAPKGLPKYVEARKEIYEYDGRKWVAPSENFMMPHALASSLYNDESKPIGNEMVKMNSKSLKFAEKKIRGTTKDLLDAFVHEKDPKKEDSILREFKRSQGLKSFAESPESIERDLKIEHDPEVRKMLEEKLRGLRKRNQQYTPQDFYNENKEEIERIIEELDQPSRFGFNLDWDSISDGTFQSAYGDFKNDNSDDIEDEEELERLAQEAGEQASSTEYSETKFSERRFVESINQVIEHLQDGEILEAEKELGNAWEISKETIWGEGVIDDVANLDSLVSKYKKFMGLEDFAEYRAESYESAPNYLEKQRKLEKEIEDIQIELQALWHEIRTKSDAPMEERFEISDKISELEDDLEFKQKELESFESGAREFAEEPIESLRKRAEMEKNPVDIQALKNRENRESGDVEKLKELVNELLGRKKLDNEFVLESKPMGSNEQRRYNWSQIENILEEISKIRRILKLKDLGDRHSSEDYRIIHDPKLALKGLENFAEEKLKLIRVEGAIPQNKLSKGKQADLRHKKKELASQSNSDKKVRNVVSKDDVDIEKFSMIRPRMEDIRKGMYSPPCATDSVKYALAPYATGDISRTESDVKREKEWKQTLKDMEKEFLKQQEENQKFAEDENLEFPESLPDEVITREGENLVMYKFNTEENGYQIKAIISPSGESLPIEEDEEAIFSIDMLVDPQPVPGSKFIEDEEEFSESEYEIQEKLKRDPDNPELLAKLKQAKGRVSSHEFVKLKDELEEINDDYNEQLQHRGSFQKSVGGIYNTHRVFNTIQKANEVRKRLGLPVIPLVEENSNKIIQGKTFYNSYFPKSLTQGLETFSEQDFGLIESISPAKLYMKYIMKPMSSALGADPDSEYENAMYPKEYDYFSEVSNHLKEVAENWIPLDPSDESEIEKNKTLFAYYLREFIEEGKKEGLLPIQIDTKVMNLIVASSYMNDDIQEVIDQVYKEMFPHGVKGEFAEKKGQ